MKDINELKKELFEAIDTICKDYEKKPEFKVGQWVVFMPGTAAQLGLCTSIWDKHYVLRIEKIFGSTLWFSAEQSQCITPMSNRATSISNDAACFRPATPQEIEAHLKKIAIEKGFKDGVIAKFPNGMGKRELHGSFRYDPNWLATEDCLSMGDDVIWRPKYGWVEILPSLKKLPKTKEELRQFFEEFADRDQGDFNFFLDQYED